MNNIKCTFKEVGRAKISEKRNLVISESSKGGYVLAQQMKIEEGLYTTNLFLKGTIQIDSLDELRNIRDTINYILEKES